MFNWSFLYKPTIIKNRLFNRLYDFIKNVVLFLSKRPWIVVLMVMIISTILRVWIAMKIHQLIFDENYYVKFASIYAKGQFNSQIVHPTLSQFLMIPGIKIFGDKWLGYRIMAVLFGSLLIWMSYLLGKELVNKRVGFLAAMIFALDGMIFIYSYSGQAEVFLLFFILFSLFLFLRFIKSRKIIYLFLAGLATGLTATIKYTGGSIVVLFLIMLLIEKFPIKRYFWYLILSLFFIPLLVYLGSFLVVFWRTDFFTQVFQWHRNG